MASPLDSPVADSVASKDTKVSNRPAVSTTVEDTTTSPAESTVAVESPTVKAPRKRKTRAKAIATTTETTVAETTATATVPAESATAASVESTESAATAIADSEGAGAAHATEVDSSASATVEPIEATEATEESKAQGKAKPTKAKAPKKAKTAKKAVDPFDMAFIAEHAQKAIDLSAPVLLCPVRHHSFALSLHLPRLIAAYQPDCIAVEMPSVFKDEVASLGNSEVVPPVAFFSFATPKKAAAKAKTTKSTKSGAGAANGEEAVDATEEVDESAKATEGTQGEVTPSAASEDESDNYRSYLYPMLPFSPEYVALTEAMKQGIDYELIDLTSFARESFTSFSEESTYYDDDQVMMRSKFYQELLERSGDHSFAEFWDKNFEVNALTQDTLSYLRQIYSYCYMLRYGLNEDSETFTVQRELFMLKNVQAAMKTHQRVLVITGGIHSVALCDYLYYKKKKVTAERFAKVPSETYLIPYSFAGVDSQQGYGAGIVFPYYYQQFYQVLKDFVPFMSCKQGVQGASGTATKTEASLPDAESSVAVLPVVKQQEVEADNGADGADEQSKSEVEAEKEDADAKAAELEAAAMDMEAADAEFFAGMDRSNLALAVLSSLLKENATVGTAARKAAVKDDDSSKNQSRAKRAKGKKNKAAVYYDALGREINISSLTGTGVEQTERSQLILSLAQKEQQELGAKPKKEKAAKSEEAVATEVGAEATAVAETAETIAGEPTAAVAAVELTLEQKEELLKSTVSVKALTDVSFALNLFFISQLRDYRKQKFSTADKISCEQSLRGLAALRQKLVPSVFELIDAVRSTLIKEEITERYYLLDQLMLLLTSVRMGQVPLNVRMPPLWRDFLQQTKTYGISLKDQNPHQLRIDINKNEKSLGKSRLINRIAFLSPVFLPADLNAEGNHTFNYISRTETYVYKYSDEVVMQLMGASVHGESLLQACRSVLREHCKAPNLSLEQICALYRQCVNMGIEDQYYHVKELLAQAILKERQLIKVGRALSELNSYDFVAKSTDENREILLSLIYDLVKRGCEILLQQNDVEEAELDEFVHALEELNYYAIKHDNTRQLYFSVLEEMLASSDLGATLQGAYLALLYKNHRLRYEVLVDYVNQFVLGSINNSKHSGGFFYTLILISRGNLFNRDSILALLNTYLSNLDGDEFLKVLVLLRRVFSHFNSVELHKLVRMLKRILGLDTLDFTYQVDPQEFLRNRQIDQDLEHDMRKWHLLVNSARPVTVAQAAKEAVLASDEPTVPAVQETVAETAALDTAALVHKPQE